jgi:hypothetical protein
MIRGRGELCVWWVRSHIYWFPIIQTGLLGDDELQYFEMR